MKTVPTLMAKKKTRRGRNSTVSETDKEYLYQTSDHENGGVNPEWFDKFEVKLYDRSDDIITIEVFNNPIDKEKIGVIRKKPVDLHYSENETGHWYPLELNNQT